MSSATSRMQFLRGDFAGRKVPIRPPWALDEYRFTNACDQCGRCLDVCPTQVLQRGRGGFPVVDFSRGECLFCEDCVGVCKTEALSKLDGEPPWMLKATIDDDTCIAFQNTECRGCLDPCGAGAIRTLLRPGGIAVPWIDVARCTGCGACYPVCPVRAVSVRPFVESE